MNKLESIKQKCEEALILLSKDYAEDINISGVENLIEEIEKICDEKERP